MREVNLPEGWALSTLAQSIAVDGIISDGDWVESKDQDPNGLVRLIQLADIGDGDFKNKSERFMTPESASFLNCTFLKPGDVLVARMPDPLGRACIFPEVGQKAVTVVDVCLIRPGEKAAISNKLLTYWINSPEIRSLIAENASGTTRKRITRKKLEQFEFPLPPLAEQKVIVDKLDTLLAQVETSKARLGRIPHILKNFRQSVLAAAVSGKLTEKWRGKNIYSAEQQFNVLLKNEEAYLALKKKDDKSKIFKEKAKFRIQKTDNSNMELPQGWCQKPFFEFCLLNRGFDLPNDKRIAGEYSILSAGGEIGTHNEFKVEGPCITVGRSGSVGQVFYTEKNTWPLNTALYAKDMSISYPKFVYYKLLTMNLSQFSSSTSVPTLNRNEFTHEIVEIPPFEEQIEIVRHVEELFAFTDRIEQKAKAALERVNNLTQSILAKAFKGKLTSDWRAANPDLTSGENSAEALLKKNKAEREILKKQPKKNSTVKKEAGSHMSKQIIKVVNALKEADRPLNGQQLLAAAGYPSDSSTDLLEQFFLDIREALTAEKSIVKLERSDDGQDWFDLARTAETNKA